jgi:alpha-L-fucosidase
MLTRYALALSLNAAFLSVHAQSTAAVPQGHPVSAVQDVETPVQRDARMGWWREARFGMFIHWGLYALPGGVWHGKPVDGIGEWIMNRGSIPVSDYQKLASQFNPVAFNAHGIVALAKSAGMRYIVITAKHHDGFAMFNSKADSFNIVAATPFKRDPLRELTLEAKQQGIKLGLYYSQDQDWTAPGGAALPTGNHRPPNFHWDTAQDGEFAEYLHVKAIPQLRELLSNYGDFPAILWFDTPTKQMTPILASDIVVLLNQHPKLIWNNRLGGGYAGDIETPEQTVPPRGFPGKDWETCMTINDTWGYKSGDTNFKSTSTLLRNLVDIASKGGNYLLNIGPDSNGAVPAPEVERLREIGRWLEVNGEAIYGTSATPFDEEHARMSASEKDDRGAPHRVPVWDWRATTRPGKVYVHLLTWPGRTFHLPDARIHATAAYLLADPKHTPLSLNQTGNSLDVQLSNTAPDPLDTVLVIETKDEANLRVPQ